MDIVKTEQAEMNKVACDLREIVNGVISFSVYCLA